jgi:hypothetical protein
MNSDIYALCNIATRTVKGSEDEELTLWEVEGSVETLTRGFMIAYVGRAGCIVQAMGFAKPSGPSYYWTHVLTWSLYDHETCIVRLSSAANSHSLQPADMPPFSRTLVHVSGACSS